MIERLHALNGRRPAAAALCTHLAAASGLQWCCGKPRQSAQRMRARRTHTHARTRTHAHTQCQWCCCIATLGECWAMESHPDDEFSAALATGMQAASTHSTISRTHPHTTAAAPSSCCACTDRRAAGHPDRAGAWPACACVCLRAGACGARMPAGHARHSTARLPPHVPPDCACGRARGGRGGPAAGAGATSGQAGGCAGGAAAQCAGAVEERPSERCRGAGAAQVQQLEGAAAGAGRPTWPGAGAAACGACALAGVRWPCVWVCCSVRPVARVYEWARAWTIIGCPHTHGRLWPSGRHQGDSRAPSQRGGAHTLPSVL